MNEIGNNSPIENQHLDNALDFLIENNFLVKDICDSNDLIKEVIESCYEQKIIPEDINSAQRNKNDEKSKTKENLHTRILEAFNKRSFWDKIFYNKMIK